LPKNLSNTIRYVNSFKKKIFIRKTKNIKKKLQKEVLANYVITCGGLQSDELSLMTGCQPDPYILPIRGEYLLLGKEKAHLVKGNIYPVMTILILIYN